MRYRCSALASLVSLLALSGGGCTMPGATPAGAPQQQSDGKTMVMSGPLHAPGAGGSTNATEWTIELQQESVAKGRTKSFAAIDVSNVQEQAKALEGQRVRARVVMPTQADAGRSAVQVQSLEAAPEK